MNEHETTEYPPVSVEIRSSSTTKGGSPGVTVRATSKATSRDAATATFHALEAWRVVQLELSRGLTSELKASIEHEKEAAATHAP